MLEIIKRPKEKKYKVTKFRCECGCVFKTDEYDWHKRYDSFFGVCDCKCIKCPLCNRLVTKEV